MDSTEFQIFEPDRKFHLTSDLLFFGLIVITAGVLYAFNQYIPGIIIKLWCIGLFVFIVVLAFSSYFTYMPLFGKLNGEIIFAENSINTDGKIYKLSEINNIDFDLYDFYGRKSGRIHSFNPKMSQGVDNYVKFTDNLNQSHKIYFKLATQHHYEELAPFISEAIKSNKMSRERGITLLGEENILD